MTQKDLGQISAVSVGTSPPSNLAMIWIDRTAGYNPKYYDTNTSSWRSLKIGNAVHTGSADPSALFDDGDLYLTTVRPFKLYKQVPGTPSTWVLQMILLDTFVPQWYKKLFTYNDFKSLLPAAAVVTKDPLTIISPGIFVHNMCIQNSDGFTSSGALSAAVLDVGDASDAQRYFASHNLFVSGTALNIESTNKNGLSNFTAPTNIKGKLTLTGDTNDHLNLGGFTIYMLLSVIDNNVLNLP